jgi:hypothetical protein
LKVILYYKLRTFKLAMKSTTMILKFSLIVGFVYLLFCSFICICHRRQWDSYPLGFLVVGGIYLITDFYFERQDCRRTFIRKIFRNILTKPWELKYSSYANRQGNFKIEKNKLSKKLFWVSIGQKLNAESFIEQLLGIL